MAEPPHERPTSGGFRVDHAGDVSFNAVGDIVAGDKTTILLLLEKAPPSLTQAPYKFLSHYEVSDARFFFGRDAEASDLAARVHSHRALIISSPPGTGKTSLINAGLLPRLAEAGYRYLMFRDYSDP